MITKDMKILVVDDQEIIFAGIKGLVSSYFEIPEISHTSILNTETLLNKPDLIIIDIKLFRKSLVIIEKIRKYCKKTKILIFTALDERVHAIPHFKKGVTGYLSKNADQAEILHAIEMVLEGKRYCSYAVKELIFDQAMSTQSFQVEMTKSKRSITL